MFGLSESTAVIARLHEAIDEALGLEPAVLAAVVEDVLVVKARTEALASHAAAAFDAHADPDCPATTATVLANRYRIPKPIANALVSNGRALRVMPEVDGAFCAGQVTGDHVRPLAAAQRRCPKAFEKAEAELIDEARTLRFDVFRRRVQYFVQLADEDGVEADADSLVARRELYASRTFEGMIRADGWMEPVSGSVWFNELDRLEKIEFEADWREARERLGDAATSGDLRRTPAQRRHDAQVEMARRSAAMPADAKHGRYLLSVLVGYETMHGRICELADGTVLTPGQLLPLLTNADVERAVFGPGSRVIDLGRRERLFKGGTRRAVQLSDVECTEDTCDVRFERCDVDHVERWEHGGPTDRANGRLRCPRHHEGRRRAPPSDGG